MKLPRLRLVTRAPGEGPRVAGIDGKCESSHEADTYRSDSVCSSNEAEAPLRCPQGGSTRALALRRS